ncbi:MAG TPA: FlgD immunoglobulin-like domain containing protein [Streptosporangiaceae bacterium]|nr:FlgD immunoglobulin-like domain containing protein [Streptosporangiaceae bacterium]
MARQTPLARLIVLLLATLPGLVLGLVGGPAAWAAAPPAAPAPTAPIAPTGAPAPGTVDQAILDQLSWRNVGPVRGGRSIAVGGSAARPAEYYFGATGGGLWKTADGGTTWRPVTDGRLTSSSVGAVEVCPADPDVVYIGMGEVELRGDIIPGDGVYKTTDGGATWRHLGLADTQTISRIRTDPRDCDRVYVAALGHPFGANAERGVFRSTDGGANWSKVLFRDELTGASDIAVDPGDPDVLYAGFWHVFRTPWLLNSGGDSSGLFKSTDGGDTWTELTGRPGLPGKPLGKIGVTVSPADPDRVFAMIEADQGGLFRSDDGGATWDRVNQDRSLRQRAFYYTRVYADTKDRDTVYVLNVSFMKSTDGGATFRSIATPHGDNHDLWIAPDDPRRMIEGNDGGANVTTDGGSTWTAQDYSTAQMYHVTTTNDSPYLICGSQQDSDTACVSSEGDGTDFFEVAGGESGYIAVDPRDSNVFYGGSFGGFLSRFDRRTEQARNVNPWPDNPMGHPARDLEHRFQWTFPIVTNPAEPRAVYAGSQFVLKSTSDGQRWRRISPDLTYADPATLGDSGGPITKDQTSIEYFATVFAIAPSTRDPDVIWAGSDDGRVNVTRDGGGRWADRTPAGLRKFTRVSIIDAGHHDRGTAYVAAHNYRLDDPAPYLFKTHDFGRTWTPITAGIARDDFAWAIREDPVRPGLLYATTQHGVYVSFDDGAHWQSLRLDLPDTSVQDLTVKNGDVVIATHGRGFYVLDDGATLLRGLRPGMTASQAPRIAIHRPAASGLPPAVPAGSAEPAAPGSRRTGIAADPVTSGGVTLDDPADPIRSVDPGVRVTYRLAEAAQQVSLTFLDRKGREIRTFTGQPTEPGAHTFTWNLRYPGPTAFPGLIYWQASATNGPKAALGTYRVRLTVDGRRLAQDFVVRKDPRLTGISARDIAEQFRLGLRVRDRTSDANDAVISIRACSTAVADRVTGANDPQVTRAGSALREALSAVENEIYQTRLQSAQDPLNFPIKLNNKIAALLGVIESADDRPTDQTFEVFRLLSGLLEVQLGRYDALRARDVPAFSELVEGRGLPPVTCADDVR